jgi:hypothetical protein
MIQLIFSRGKFELISIDTVKSLGVENMKFVLYSKPDCHLCEGLAEKLNLVTDIPFELEIRDITTNESWFNAYQYEIPVLCLVTDDGEKPLPRLSPRASVKQITKQLQAVSS